jgi:hypothetical protein
VPLEAAELVDAVPGCRACSLPQLVNPIANTKPTDRQNIWFILKNPHDC